MILLICTKSSFEEANYLQQIAANNTGAIRWNSIPVSDVPVDACIDLLFDNSQERVVQLKNTSAKIVFVNLVAETCTSLPDNFIRINGWTGFWQRGIVECAAKNSNIKPLAEETISVLGKKIEWTPDIPGFISARVVAAIINEAYFSLGEGVSSKENIDLAMKLGTNYPMGPFEWSSQIGLKNILSLLNKMSETSSRYLPAALLKQEALLQ